MQINPESIVATECAERISELVDRLPKPDTVDDQRKARRINILRLTLRKKLTTILEGGKVKWEEICSFKDTFLKERTPFYKEGTIATVDRMIKECIQDIEGILDPDYDPPHEPPKEKPKIIHGLVYASSSMAEIVKLTTHLADSDASVLVLGETGTGKELVAKLLHFGSKKRKRRLFRAINCTAISGELLESELFGHKKGAFTGAFQNHKGLLEAVGEGTLFLDEIGDMDPRLQAKLLRVLQERKFRQVGDSGKELEFKGRIVAATNKDLVKAVGTGTFRADLFYRIAQFQLDIPPLRERPEDMAALIDHFLRKTDPNAKLSAEAHRKIMSHTFPGNVRELENVIQNAYLFAKIRNENNIVIEPDDIKFHDVNGNGQEKAPAEPNLREQLAALTVRIEQLENKDQDGKIPLPIEEGKLMEIITRFLTTENLKEIDEMELRILMATAYWFMSMEQIKIGQLAEELKMNPANLSRTLSRKRYEPKNIKKIARWVANKLDLYRQI
ncbi:sigma-54-dependent Fis family transcriptional regulator [Candidatus Peregrinibacteria bacterium]|jgi:transcriptional regulator with GAF, ATPase, and Fis domain|nr:sigma-54-dependent Fis family transcriptional regulator [Candidatus Peregrinibacteria bacterium]